MGTDSSCGKSSEEEGKRENRDSEAGKKGKPVQPMSRILCTTGHQFHQDLPGAMQRPPELSPGRRRQKHVSTGVSPLLVSGCAQRC